MTFVQAYLDPASGGVILQTIVAVVTGAGVITKLYWRRIKKFLRIGADKDGAEVEPSKADGS